MHALLLHNPDAGTKDHAGDDLIAALKLAGLTARYVSTKDDRDAADALAATADLLVVAGGDGTVRHALTRLPDRNTPVALLPLGSANNIARSMGISGIPRQLPESWRIGRTRPFDLGTVSRAGKAAPIAEGFGIGVIAETMLRRERKSEVDGAENIRRGRETLRQVLQESAALDVTLSVDGRRIEGDFLGIEVLNICFTGPGLPLAFTADPGDGLLDVICIERERRQALIDWLDAPLDCAPPAATRRGRSIEIAWRNAPVRTDDIAEGPSGERQRARVALDGRPIRILMPLSDPVPTRGKSGT